MPDANSVMAPVRECAFNDAPWLVVASAQQRMAHPDLGNDAAEALGCQSLRYHHQGVTWAGASRKTNSWNLASGACVRLLQLQLCFLPPSTWHIQLDSALD